MSTEASYSLQQSLYTLYRKYYHSGCVVLLNSKSFAHGTVRLQKPGLYVVCEDVEFNPNPSYLQSNPEYSTNNAYSMGYFAALTVEADGVIIDLQGHTIRQSYEHYARQRFFSVIELANAPFVTGQGPGSVQTSTGFVFKAATNCLIINGTLGLSSHSGVHGNNNANIMLQNVCVQDFESAGVQLNGVDTAFMDCVTIKGLECVPLTAHTFSLVRLQEVICEMEAELEGQATFDVPVSGDTGAAACVTLNRLDICTALDDLLAFLFTPFLNADLDHTSAATPLSVTAALRGICECLQQLDDSSTITCSSDASNTSNDTLRWNIQRYIQKPDSTGSPAPDGSALYGMLFNSTGVAVGELSAVCPANGKACCPAGHGSGSRGGGYTSDCCRPSKSVTIHNCSVSGLRLNARESVGVKQGDTMLRDGSGKIVDISVLDRIQGGGLQEFAQVYVNREKTGQTTWDVCIQRTLLCTEDDYTYVDLMAECTDLTFVYNVDVMAHVSKGVFGIRSEDTKGLCIENTTIKSLKNTSTTTCPRTQYGLPPDANILSIITRDLDQTTDTSHGGANMRGVFVGRSEGILLTKLTLDTLTSQQGLCRGVELDTVDTGCVHALTSKALDGILTTVVHAHHQCTKLTMRELSSATDTRPAATTAAYETLLEDVRQACIDADAHPDDTTKQKFKTDQLCRLLRLPYPDTHLLAFESPAKTTGDIRLC